MNLNTRQDIGKIKWRWEDSYEGMRFLYSEYLLDNGLSMLWFTNSPNVVIVHRDHNNRSSIKDMMDFIHKGFSIIDVKVDIVNCKIDRFVYSHGYTDFEFEINVQGEMV